MKEFLINSLSVLILLGTLLLAVHKELQILAIGIIVILIIMLSIKLHTTVKGEEKEKNEDNED